MVPLLDLRASLSTMLQGGGTLRCGEWAQRGTGGGGKGIVGVTVVGVRTWWGSEIGRAHV